MLRHNITLACVLTLCSVGTGPDLRQHRAEGGKLRLWGYTVPGEAPAFSYRASTLGRETDSEIFPQMHGNARRAEQGLREMYRGVVGYWVASPRKSPQDGQEMDPQDGQELTGRSQKAEYMQRPWVRRQHCEQPSVWSSNGCREGWAEGRQAGPCRPEQELVTTLCPRVSHKG